MKPLPVYSIELRLAAPMALAAAASLPPSCAWLVLANASASVTMTVRSIVSSLQSSKILCRPLAGLSDCRFASAFHRIAHHHARRIGPPRWVRVAAAVQSAAVGPYIWTAPAPVWIGGIGHSQEEQRQA